MCISSIVRCAHRLLLLLLYVLILRWCVAVIFFFFKQKTAYELRISDWSSDVCSSDLMSALVGQSQGATGALQATQAGNQLLALQAQQLADLTAVVAANGRAQNLSEAERAAAAEQGREQRRRFLTPGSGYQPGNARMFPNGN